MSGQRVEDVVPVLLLKGPKREEGGGKRKIVPFQEGDRVIGDEEGSSEKKSEPSVAKVRRRKGEPTEDGGEVKRRRKPKAIVEVNSTFTELRRLLQEMRPSTIQVLKTPYYRNCKAARNMRKGVRQIRDFCKQVRLETVLLAKKKQGEEMSKKRRKPEASTLLLEAGEDAPKKKKKVTPPPEVGDETAKQKKKKSDAPLLLLTLEAGEDGPRKREKPEVSSPPDDDTPEEENREEAEGETPPHDIAEDDESAREPEVASPPLEVSLDDDGEGEGEAE